MKTDEALSYLIVKALDCGYDMNQINCFRFELRERLNDMPVTDQEELDQLFEELF